MAGRGPAYRIETARMVLRCWRPEDGALLKAAVDASLEHLRPWMPWAASEPQEVAAKVERLRRVRGEFDLGQNYGYGLFDPDERVVLGSAGLHTRAGAGAREIGYWVHAGYANQGLGTEATAALVKVAFLLDEVTRVEIHCDPENLRSVAIPRKLGFVHEATLRKRKATAAGELRDVMIWTLFSDAFPSSPSARAAIAAWDAGGHQLI